MSNLTKERKVVSGLKPVHERRASVNLRKAVPGPVNIFLFLV